MFVAIAIGTAGIALVGPASASFAAAGSASAQVIDPFSGSPTDVSCPTTTFCAAADRHGKVALFKGTTWSAPVAIDGTETSPMQDFRISSISCSAATFCMALVENGDLVTFNGTTWTPHKGAMGISWPGDAAVSCISATRCVAVASSDYVVFNGTSFTTHAPTGDNSAGSLSDISCVSATFCMAIDSMGNAARFNGSSWTLYTGVAPNGGNAVRCVSASWCLAVGQNQAAIFNGTIWSSAPALNATSAAVNGLACRTAQFCVAVDASGAGYTFDGVRWSSDATADPIGGLQAVACSAVAKCTAIDMYGSVVTYNGATWSTPKVVDHDTGFLTSISCPTRTFCGAADANGNALTFNGASWTAPHTVNARYQFNSISCASATFCAAVGSAPVAGTDVIAGSLAMFDGTTWKSVATPEAWNSISCPTSSFCLGLAWNDDVLTYDGTSWTVTTRQDLNYSGGQVYCLSSTFCMSGPWKWDGAGWSYTATNLTVPADSGACATTSYCVVPAGLRMDVYDGQKWTLSGQNGSYSKGGPISCPSTTFCVNASSTGYVTTFQNNAPGQPVTVDSPGIDGHVTGMSCPTTGTCRLVDDTKAVTWLTGQPEAPLITSQPKDKTAVSGTQVTFSAAGSGTPTPTITWQKSTDQGATWANVSGATTSPLTVTASSNSRYRAIFSNASGTGTTRAAVLTIAIKPTITKSPVSHSAVHGSATTFTAAATGTPAPTVRWQASTDGGTHWTDVSGATKTTLSLTASKTMNGYRYRAVFTNMAGTAVTRSGVLTVT